MKRLFYYIKRIWFYFFGNKIDKLNLKLEKAALDQIKNRAELKQEISKTLKHSFGIYFGKRSKYIPPKGHNPTLIYNYVIKHFGDKMKLYNLKLTKNLIWK